MDYDTTVPSLLDAAERAAEAGDFVAAGAHLRAAADRQEAHLGAGHPDLANTLNNLGVVLERTGDDEGAESAYRRAYAIAQASLAPDHPFVATSAGNLREFCAARGLAFERPPAPPAAARAASDELSGADVFLPEEPLAEKAILPPGGLGAGRDSRAAEDRVGPTFDTELRGGGSNWTTADTANIDSPGAPRFRPAVLAGGVAALAVVALAMWAYTRQPEAVDPAPAPAVASTPDTNAGAANSGNAPVEGSPGSGSDTTSETQAPVGKPEANASSTPPASSGRSSSPGAPAAAPEANAGSGRAAAAAPAGVTVVRADVCRTFSASGEWRCDRVDGPVGPGRLVFYTRVRSPSPLAIEHRWYHGSDLVQRVPLRIGANPGAGYRTFSRQTIVASRAGEWRAELRTADGGLLAEVRFDVR